MSLVLEGAVPEVDIKTSNFYPGANKVLIGIYEIPMNDFTAAVEYVLTNTRLEENDPRIRLVERVKSIQVVLDDNGGKLEVDPRLNDR